jgi:hypothetical protein
MINPLAGPKPALEVPARLEYASHAVDDKGQLCFFNYEICGIIQLTVSPAG